MLSRQYVQTLRTWDMKSNRLLFQLAPSVRRTGETEYGLLHTVQTQGLKVCDDQRKTVFMDLGLLPTPKARDGISGPAKVNGQKITRPSGQTYSTNLNDLAYSGLLPTPQAIDGNGSGRPLRMKLGNRNPESLGTWRGDLKDYAHMGMLPTPMDSDCGEKVTGLENQNSLVKISRETTGKTSQLNPLFVAEMMGFPTDWTLLPFQNGEQKA